MHLTLSPIQQRTDPKPAPQFQPLSPVGKTIYLCLMSLSLFLPADEINDSPGNIITSHKPPYIPLGALIFSAPSFGKLVLSAFNLEYLLLGICALLCIVIYYHLLVLMVCLIRLSIRPCRQVSIRHLIVASILAGVWFSFGSGKYLPVYTLIVFGLLLSIRRRVAKFSWLPKIYAHFWRF